MVSKGLGIDRLRWGGWELGEGVPLTLPSNVVLSELNLAKSLP